jgi:hypothetical protein
MGGLRLAARQLAAGPDQSQSVHRCGEEESTLVRPSMQFETVPGPMAHVQVNMASGDREGAGT